MESEIVSVNGIQLHTLHQGVGQPLLLLHGVTDNASYWGWTASMLAQTYDVIALDQRGHGLSDGPESGYRMTDYVADAAAVLRLCAARPAIVIGHSFGGWVGTRLAAEHPELVRSLILEDPPFRGNAPEVRSTQEQDRIRFEWFSWLRELAGKTRQELVQRCQADNPAWSQEDCDHWALSKLQVRPRIYEAGGIEFDTRWQEAAARVRCPTLLIYGDEARGSIVNREAAMFVQTLIKDCTLVHIVGAGHAIHRDRAQNMMSEIQRFLARTTA